MTPIERLANLVVGTVESVSPNEVRVLLELEAPHTTALNTGSPVPFPRINGYVLIPNETGATVAYISWMGIERSPYPKRSGLQDFGLIDLPFPLRKMYVSPVGTLTCFGNQKQEGHKYELTRGVLAFPSIGDQVLLPTPEQIEAIVGGKDKDKRIQIGTSPMSSNAKIMVDPDKLFGRHLAVLGNTGSGKSCTVAGLIRWSLEASQKALKQAGKEGVPNARFIILDPNGEYAKAFADQGNNVRLFRVPPVSGNDHALDVPAWAWSGHEWTAVAHAQPGAQRPLLMLGLRELKSEQTDGVPREAIIRRYLQSYSTRLSAMLAMGTQAFAGAPRARFECARLLERIEFDCAQFAAELDGLNQTSLTGIVNTTNEIRENRKSNNPQFYDDFAISDLEAVRAAINGFVVTLPDIAGIAPISEDAPKPFNVNLLADHLERIATEQGGNLAGFISTLGLRIRGMLSDRCLGPVIGRNPATPFDAWLTEYVGDTGASNGSIGIIDLSLIPSEVIHIVMSVLARLIFEALQRYRRCHPDGNTLPTVLVLEEAHTFIRRGFDDDGPAETPARLCRETFERIAREGRKFGLGLVLSSQRPSELSPTVLAQCNTFLLHRIVNDADQKLVSSLVPDNVAALLRELPSLPSRQAILMGWATPIPVLVDVNELLHEHRPHSADPDFWDVWTLAEERAIDWRPVLRDWLGEAPVQDPPG